MRTLTFGARSPSFAGNRVASWSPTSTGTGQAFGWSFGATGTVTLETLSDSSFRTQVPRTRISATATVLPPAAAVASLISADPIGSQGDADGHGGAQVVIRFALPIDGSSTGAFVGLSALSTAVLSGSGFGDSVGVGFGSSSSSGTAWNVVLPSNTVIPIGTALRNTSSVYALTIIFPPHDGSTRYFRMQLVDLATNTLHLDGVYPSTAFTLPAAATQLYVHAEIYAGLTTTRALEVVSMEISMPDGATRPLQETGEAGIFNLRDFGAIGDFDGSTGTDNMSALRSLLRALNGVGGTVILPPGGYYFGSQAEVDLNITGSIILRGAGPGGRHAPTRLHFAPFCGLHVVRRDAMIERELPPEFVLEDIALIGGHSGEEGHERAVDWPAWSAETVSYSVFAGTHTSANTVVPPGPRLEVNVIPPAAARPDASFEYLYVCIKSGAPGATAPPFHEAYMPDSSKPYGTGTYALGEIVRAPNIYDRVYKVTTAGTTGGIPPFSWPNSPVTDGTVVFTPIDASPFFVADGGTLASPTGCVWACRAAAGLRAECRVSLRRVYFENFFNGGLHLQDSERIFPPTGTNGCLGSAGYDVRVVHCGVGAIFRGAATGAAFFGLQVHAPRPPEEAEPEEVALYDRHLGIVERSYNGSSILGPRVSCTGPTLFVTGSDNATTVGGPFFREGDGPLDLRSPKATTWGGRPGLPLSDASFQGALSRTDWRGVASTLDLDTDISVTFKPDAASVLGFQSEDDAEAFRHVYGLPAEGWWGVTYGATTVAMAYSNGTTPFGGGLTWFPGALHFRQGPFLRIKFSVGPDPSLTPATIGDVVFNEGAASGQPLYWQMTANYGWQPGPTL